MFVREEQTDRGTKDSATIAPTFSPTMSLGNKVPVTSASRISRGNRALPAPTRVELVLFVLELDLLRSVVTDGRTNYWTTDIEILLLREEPEDGLISRLSDYECNSHLNLLTPEIYAPTFLPARTWYGIRRRDYLSFAR